MADVGQAQYYREQIVLWCEKQVRFSAFPKIRKTGGNNLSLVEQDHISFSLQRVDQFVPSRMASTQSARQHKDTTNLISQAADTDTPLLIRRLTPLECERLQGFPDGWTGLVGASDSARYRALDNSVAIPCVEHIMRGIVMAADQF